MGPSQGVVRPILDAPALLLQVQPLFLIQLGLGSRGHQPSLMELALGTHATINPGDLQCSGQTQFLGLNRPGDDGPGFLASAPRASLLPYRGEGPPAGVAGRFGAGWAGYPGGSGCNRRLGHRGSDARFGVGCLGAIAGGYLMEHGKFLVLVQPAELLIILGSAIGTVVVANPIPTLMRIVKGMLGILAGSPFNKAFYLESLKMIYELYNVARKSGTAKLEEEVDNPGKSPVFSKYPKFMKSHHALNFLCDTLRMAVSGGVDPMEIDQMMEVDMEVHHRESAEPITALTTMADSLPGLGIVAAVLGIVITMGSLGGPKEQIGEHVAAALVGTFLGILLCYGVFGPLAQAMGKQSDAEANYLAFLRMAAIGFIKGLSPIMAVELARRSIPSTVRPSFQEVEGACRGGGKTGG